MPKRTLSIDIETYSSADLKKTGVYRYSEAEDFEILMIAYSYDGGPVEIIDLKRIEYLEGLAGLDDLTDIEEKEYQELVAKLEKLVADIQNPDVIKLAFNANFERVCIAAHFKISCLPEQWQCTMILCAMLGLPMSLAEVGRVLNLEQQKDWSGANLIRYFSIPCKPSKVNGGRTRNLPEHAPEKWQSFKDYCVKDVEVEMAVRDKLSFFTIPQSERELWWLDQRINDRGVKLDRKLVKNAVEMDLKYRAMLIKEATEITQLENPNSVSQICRWLEAETGEEVTTLKKADIPVLMGKFPQEKIQRMLEIRKELGKTSVKKYVAMAHAMCKDGRVRGLLQFYGANRTGRFSGRLLQIQNLPQNKMSDTDLDFARELVKDGDMENVDFCFGNIADTLSQLIRTALVAEKGHMLAAVDFSSIELIVIAWLAGEQWIIDEYKGTRKIYEATAARMLKMDVKDVKKGSMERQKGKIASLACQYGGGVNALISMGALNMGLVEDDLKPIVDAWRDANPNIKAFWYAVGDAAMSAIEGQAVAMPKANLKFYCRKGFLFIELPSGRCLSYYKARIIEGKFGKAIGFMGQNQTTKKWELIETHGSKLVENICQAVARDCLAESMLRLYKKGYEIIMHVHDEIVCEIPEENAEMLMKEISDIMSANDGWAATLPLGTEGIITKYYKK